VLDAIVRRYIKLDENNKTGVRYVLDIAGTMGAAAGRRADGAAPVLKPPQNKIGFFRIVGEVGRFRLTR